MATTSTAELRQEFAVDLKELTRLLGRAKHPAIERIEALGRQIEFGNPVALQTILSELEEGGSIDIALIDSIGTLPSRESERVQTIASARRFEAHLRRLGSVLGQVAQSGSHDTGV